MAGVLFTLANFNVANGANPVGGVIVDANGDLIGTTSYGGLGGYGTVFEIKNNGTLAAPSYAFAPTTLVNFNGGNGASPQGSLIADAAGDLFGTTENGGLGRYGTVFEIKNNGTLAAPIYASAPTTLVNFNDGNGAFPTGSLIVDANGDLFGATLNGGSGLYGTVFEVKNYGTLAAPSYASAPTTLVNFNDANGSYVNGPLIVDANGDLLGTTEFGGLDPSLELPGYGTVFEIMNSGTLAAPSYASAPITLVNFSTLDSFNYLNGYALGGGLTIDANGDLFGTTQGGGSGPRTTAYSASHAGSGTVFEIKNNGTLAAPSYASTPTTLVSFNGANGSSPSGSLFLDARGDLFGTTWIDGSNNDGTLFEIKNNGTLAAPSYASAPTTLVNFNGANGANPALSQLIDVNGNFIGTTFGGGSSGDGTVFEYFGGPTVTFTSSPESSNQANQTIAGTVVSANGASFVTGQTVTLTDNGVVLSTSSPVTVQADGSFSANVTLPNQGANSLVASVTDTSGNAGQSAPVVDTLDSAAPTVTITSAPESSTLAHLTITGAAVSAAGAAFVTGQTVTFTDNGVVLSTSAPVTVQANGSFSASVTLTDQGANSIVASVTDTFGYSGSSAPVVDTLDSAAPTVTITSAPETSSLASQTITGTVVSAAGASFVTGQTVTFSDNGVALSTSSPVTVQADGSFSASVTLPNQGANSIVASVADIYHNSGSSTPVVDTLIGGPIVTITSSPESSDQASQTISGAVVSTNGASFVTGQTVTLTDNGVALSTAAPITVQADGSFSASVILPNQGANSLVASVTDTLGNAGQSLALVDTLDSAAPTVTITSAPESSNQANQTIDGTVVSAAGAVFVTGQTVTLTDNGVALSTSSPVTVQADGSFLASVTLPNPGANSIVASITDTYGNIGSSAPVVDTFNSASPVVTFTSAPETSNQADQTIAGTVVSPAGASFVTGQAVILTDNGVALTTTTPVTVQADGSFSADVTLPNQGVNKIVASVTDTSSNAGQSAPLVDMLDSAAPAVTITSSAETSYQADQTIEGSVVSAAGAAFVTGQTVTFTDNGVPLSTSSPVTVQANGSFSASVTLPNTGANSIVASVTDTSGNAGQSLAVVDTLETVTWTWNGSADGNWANPANWLPSGFTGNIGGGDVAIIPGGISGPYRTATEDSTGFVDIGGGIVNRGAIELETGWGYYGNLPTAAPTLDITGNVKLSGGGTLTLGDAGPNLLAAIHASSPDVSGFTFENVDNTISGAGLISGNYGELTIKNDVAGKIIADGVDALQIQQFLNVPSAQGEVVNDGLLAATGAGGLHIYATVIDQTGADQNNVSTGVIDATGAGVVYLANTTIKGGTLTASGGGTFNINYQNYGGATFDGTTTQVNISSGTHIEDNNFLALSGNIVNAGVIDVGSTSGGSILYFGTAANRNVRLSGGGTVRLGDFGWPNTANAITANAPSLISFENVDNTISGAGLIQGGNFIFQNDLAGKVIADGSNSLSITYFGAGADFINDGLIEAAAAGGLYLGSSVIDQTGADQNNVATGLIEATGAGGVHFNAMTIKGGTLAASGGGFFEIDLQNYGYANFDGTTAAVNISSGTQVKDNDSLTLSGNIVNAGAIDVGSAGGGAFLYIGSTVTNGKVRLSGGGAVTLDDFGANIPSTFSASGYNPSTVTFENVDNTISGAGVIQGYGLIFQNDQAGKIIADGADPLTINAFASNTPDVMVNDGLIEATGAGGLYFGSSVVDQTGADQNNVSTGVIEATGAGQVTFNNSIIIGGQIEATGANVVIAATTIRGATLTASSGGLFEITSTSSKLDGTTAAVTVASGTHVVVEDGQRLELTGTIANSGEIDLAATAPADATILIINGIVTPGDVVMSDIGNGANQIYADASGSKLDNTATISGAGRILSNAGMSLVNEKGATINADGVNTLTISDLPVTNDGTLEATGAGGLTLRNDTIDQTGSDQGGAVTGEIDAAGGNVAIDTTTIEGGTLTSSAGGTFEIYGGADLLDGSTAPVSITGGTHVVVEDGQTLTLTGAINNSGEIDLASSGDGTLLRIDGTVTPGDIILSDNAANTIYDYAAGSVLDNSATISGAGHIFSNSGLSLVNAHGATVNADGANALTLGGLPVTNDGTLEATGVGGLVLRGDQIDQTGGGVILANGASLVGATTGVLIDTSTVTNGFVRASGPLDASIPGVNPAATVTVGNSTLDGVEVVARGAALVDVQSSTTVKGSTTANILDGGAVNFATAFNGAVQFSGAGALTLAQKAYAGTITDLQAGDTVNLQAFGAGDQFSYTTSGDSATLTITDSADLSVDTIKVNDTQGPFAASGAFAFSDNGGVDTITGMQTICFMAGTRILTPEGETPVEQLQRGDLVMTVEGQAKPVSWLGRQTVSAVFADPLRSWPIRVKAGALGENRPSRDLLVSPDHALLVEEVLIHAGALVNGTSISRESRIPRLFVYYHVELDDHSLILAENTPAETFIDTIDRLGFDNWPEHEALFPNGKPIEEMLFPRAKARRQIPMHIRAALEARAIALRAEEISAVA